MRFLVLFALCAAATGCQSLGAFAKRENAGEAPATSSVAKKAADQKDPFLATHDSPDAAVIATSSPPGEEAPPQVKLGPDIETGLAAEDSPPRLVQVRAQEAECEWNEEDPEVRAPARRTRPVPFVVPDAEEPPAAPEILNLRPFQATPKLDTLPDDEAEDAADRSVQSEAGSSPTGPKDESAPMLAPAAGTEALQLSGPVNGDEESPSAAVGSETPDVAAPPRAIRPRGRTGRRSQVIVEAEAP